MKIQLSAITLIAITIMSCNTGKKSNSEASNSENTITSSDRINDDDNAPTIENTKWVITTLEGADLSDHEENGQSIYFLLDPETNKVSGSTGCNTIMGTYTIEEGNQISFSQMATTRMACPDGKINESEVLSIFENADNYTISDGKLSLNKAKRAPLAIFKKVEMDHAPIVEKYWKLKTLEGKDVTMADNQEREIYFMLKSEGNKVTGFAGCNTISGEYVLEEGNRIRFNHMLTTLKACPDLELNESEFLEVFELADNYTIVDDVLSLNVGRRAPLAVFEAVYFD